jgi:hypothetical protein
MPRIAKRKIIAPDQVCMEPVSEPLPEPEPIAPLPPPTPLDAVRSYLHRHFPDFVVQQRMQPSGTAQFTLYRIPDGTFYRIHIDPLFLQELWSPTDVDTFLSQQGLRPPLPAAIGGPITVRKDGVHLPRPSIDWHDERAKWRSAFKRKLLVMRVKEASGLY